MATANFSVPNNVKQAFNETFRDRNKSASIADQRYFNNAHSIGQTARLRDVSIPC